MSVCVFVRAGRPHCVKYEFEDGPTATCVSPVCHIPGMPALNSCCQLRWTLILGLKESWLHEPLSISPAHVIAVLSLSMVYVIRFEFRR